MTKLLNSLPGLDSFVDRQPGDVETALSEIEGFIETLQKDMQILEKQVHREDSLTVASVAYRLKSKAKALGIDLIHQSAVQIETSARKNRLGQLAAEIDLMKYQVDLFARSAKMQRKNCSSAAVV